MHTMNPESRMWFYGLEKPMTSAQSEQLKSVMDEFVAQWKAHGTQLAAAYRIIADQCLILAVDETQQQATGCSIDKSVHLLQEFGAKHGLDFFNRLLVFTMGERGFEALSPTVLKARITEGRIDGDTPVMNTLAATLRESGDGMITLRESWAAKYL